jgi:chromosome partition protein MukF
MLARVDATGIVAAGEYSLTSLGTVIVKSFLEDEQLTRESLALLTGAVIAGLAHIRIAAERASGEAVWRSEVVGPLRVTVSDLVGGIERRQRGLDGQQEEVQRRIGELLQADWFGAVERCQDLLESMSATLQELNEVLLRDESHIQALLQEIQQMAASASAVEAEETAQRVSEQVDRIAAWGASRQEAWSGYYQYVHRFLRDVVRLDPDRALSQRLLDQLRGWSARPFALFLASESSIRLLRPSSAKGERPPVGRPSAERERELTIVAPENEAGGPDLEELVKEALQDGPPALALVTERVLARLGEDEHYRSAGRIAALVAKLATPRSDRERPWVAVSEVVEIEDWSLDGGAG